MACADSGAGMIPCVRANWIAASKIAFCVNARASMWPSRTSSESDGASPWYRSPPACTGAGTNVCPSVNIGTSGVVSAVSPKSYANFPLVSVGQAAGSQATNVASSFPASLSPMNGYASPA